MRRRLASTLVAALLPLATSAQPAAPDLARGARAWVMCATCHGEQGQGMPALAAPALGGQRADYVVRQLRAYRSGQRGWHPEDVQGARMRLLARSLPDDALVADLAGHIATLPPPAGDRSVRGDARAGERLYRARCASCHGPQGEGLAASAAPRIAGIGDAYLVTQLRLFITGRRAGADDPAGWQMAEAARASGLDAAAIANLASHLSALAPER